MQAALDFPLSIERLTPDELAYLAKRSAKDGKSTAEVILDGFRKTVPHVEADSLASTSTSKGGNQ